ncbi:MAG: RIP metalloprotease RseP [Acidobacteriota bacterium]
MNLLVFLFVLGVLIFVHELGHYAVAKALGIQVEIFSLGFGPRLFGFRRGGTDYRISLFPIGGYVKLTGETPEEGSAGNPNEFLSRPRHQRFLVLVMGATLNILLAIGIWWGVYQVGIEEPAFFANEAVVGGVEPGSPAEEAGLQIGDRVLAIGGSPVRSWKDLHTEVSLSPGQRRVLEIDRQGRRQQVEIALTSSTRHRIGYAGIRPAVGVVVQELVPDMPAGRAGIRPGDEIIEVNGEPVFNGAEVSERIRALKGEQVGLTLLRNGQRLERQVEVSAADGIGQIGVLLTIPVRLQRYGPLEAFKKSLAVARENSGILLRALRELVRAKLSLRTLSGPIEIYRFVAHTWQEGLSKFFFSMAFISLQLGIINLMPIPVLDGGHILVLAIEGTLRRDLSLRIKERIMQVGFVFLMLLMGIVIYLDVAKNFFE